MTLNKRILIRITDTDLERLKALKQSKQAKGEAFNLSLLVRNGLSNYLNELS